MRIEKRLTDKGDGCDDNGTLRIRRMSHEFSNFTEAAGADGQRLAGMLLNGGGGGGAGAFGVNVPLIPWGQVLPGKVEETLPHFPFGTRPTDGAWQVVNGTRFKFFVYSAYFDRREGARLVRVVGATKTRGPERVWCRFWYGPSAANASDGGSSSSTRAKYSSATVMARVKVSRLHFTLSPCPHMYCLDFLPKIILKKLCLAEVHSTVNLYQKRIA